MIAISRMKKSLMYLLNTFFHSEFCYLTVPRNYKECILSAFVLVTICKTRCNSGAVLSDVGRSQLYSISFSTFVTHRLEERRSGKYCDSNCLIIRPPIQCKVDYFFTITIMKLQFIMQDWLNFCGLFAVVPSAVQ